MRPDRFIFWMLVTGLAGLALLALAMALILAGRAQAHEALEGWAYDGWCCNGDGSHGDCQEIPDSAVKVIGGNYVITLLPGEHRLVSVAHIWIRRPDEARPSGDSHYHACLFPDEATLRCFYAPPLGY